MPPIKVIKTTEKLILHVSTTCASKNTTLRPFIQSSGVEIINKPPAAVYISACNNNSQDVQYDVAADAETNTTAAKSLRWGKKKEKQEHI